MRKLTVSCIFLFCFFKLQAQEETVITMTTAMEIGSKYASFVLIPEQGVSCTISIDYGDGELIQWKLPTWTNSVHFKTKGKTIKFYLPSDSIEEIHCSRMELTALDVSACKRLKKLICSKNLLTTLNLSENTQLDYLDCSANALITLDLSKNTRLDYLDCSKNALTALNLSENTRLHDLDCRNNNLTDLDISKNIKLTNLNYDRNKIRSLDVSHNPMIILPKVYSKFILTDNDKLIMTMTANLEPGTEFQMNILPHSDSYYFDGLKIDCGSGCFVKRRFGAITFHVEDSIIKFYAPADSIEEIRCTDKQLTALDVSNCRGLKYLDCSYNNLTSLNLSQNPQLERLDCNDNNLSELDLSKNSKLEYLDCSRNPISALDLSSNLLVQVRRDSVTIVKMPDRRKSELAKRKDSQSNKYTKDNDYIGYNFGGGYTAMPFTQRDNKSSYQSIWHLDATIIRNPEGYGWRSQNIFYLISLEGSINFLSVKGTKKISPNFDVPTTSKKVLPSLALSYTLNYDYFNWLLDKDGGFGMDLKVAASLYFINPTIGINVGNVFKLNIGYSFGIKSFYGTQLSGFTIGIACSFGTYPFSIID